MNTIDENNLPENDGKKEPSRDEILLKAQKELAKNAFTTEKENPGNLSPAIKSPRIEVDEDKGLESLFEQFAIAHDAGDHIKAQKISDVLFKYGEKKLQQELKPIHFYQFLLLRIEHLMLEERYSNAADMINVASVYEREMEQISGNLFPFLTWLKAKFYLHEKLYSAVINSIDALMKGREKPIKPEIYENCMLAKVEALCGLQRYIEALSLIEKELLEANEANEFDVLKWKCEISLHLNKYDEVKKCLTIMEKIDPGNLIISVFRSRLTSAN